eukprot:2910922-Pleurochrysis_carterae.AAC.1
MESSSAVTGASDSAMCVSVESGAMELDRSTSAWSTRPSFMRFAHAGASERVRAGSLCTELR